MHISKHGLLSSRIFCDIPVLYPGTILLPGGPSFDFERYREEFADLTDYEWDNLRKIEWDEGIISLLTNTLSTASDD